MPLPPPLPSPEAMRKSIRLGCGRKQECIASALKQHGMVAFHHWSFTLQELEWCSEKVRSDKATLITEGVNWLAGGVHRQLSADMCLEQSHPHLCIRNHHDMQSKLGIHSLHLGQETNVFHEGQILQDHMRRRLGFWSGRQIGSIKKHSPLLGTCVARQTITIASSTLGIKGMSLERAAVIWSIYRLSKETTIEPLHKSKLWHTLATSSRCETLISFHSGRQ